MITKISSNEYLRRVDNMDVAEREAYLKRVGEWLRNPATMCLAETADTPNAVFQNVLQISIGWNDTVCQAWTDGVRLLTAMAGKADTWLPEMLYIKSAKRSIRQMITILETACKMQEAEAPDRKPSQRMVAGAAKEAGYIKATQAVAANAGPSSVTQSAGGEPCVVLPNIQHMKKDGMKPVPVRPKHIDQYVHLLPEKTQERAALYGPLMRELDVAREKMRLLMDDPNAGDKSRESWAKTVTKLDTKIKTIRKELDAEWDKLVEQGRVVVDDLGNAYVVEPAVAQQETEQAAETAKAASEQEQGGTGSGSAEREQAQSDKIKRIEYLKKWLRDTRTKASDERRKQWEENCRELLSLGGELTDSIRKAAGHYGVNIDDMAK